MGALVRETGRQWALLTAAWCNYMAFMCATLFYQLATFAAHPEQSLFWTLSYGISLVLLWWLRREVRARQKAHAPSQDRVNR